MINQIKALLIVYALTTSAICGNLQKNAVNTCTEELYQILSNPTGFINVINANTDLLTTIQSSTSASDILFRLGNYPQSYVNNFLNISISYYLSDLWLQQTSISNAGCPTDFSQDMC